MVRPGGGPAPVAGARSDAPRSRPQALRPAQRRAVPAIALRNTTSTPHTGRDGRTVDAHPDVSGYTSIPRHRAMHVWRPAVTGAPHATHARGSRSRAAVGSQRAPPRRSPGSRSPGYPDAIEAFDPREVAMLPGYCKYTQTYRDSVPGGNNQVEIEKWYRALGPTFHPLAPLLQRLDAHPSRLDPRPLRPGTELQPGNRPSSSSTTSSSARRGISCCCRRSSPRRARTC